MGPVGGWIRVVYRGVVMTRVAEGARNAARS